MTRVVHLHIGAPKTGTTYLQDRLDLNLASLARHGVTIPAPRSGHSDVFHFRAALDLLLERARREPDVRVFRVTISPDNEPSLALARQYPFVEVGEQWDADDGLETIFELELSASS